ncbi:MAG: hypothetical protein K9H58_18370, partial [Bacteroidales bacterium]|nr:hypothetical protein [Bacteroidales bacterium]
ANTVFSGNNKTHINYNIYLPSDMTLKLENKFGNIYCNDYKGKFTVSLSNGDFKANDLSGELNMDLNFSTATIHSIQKAELNASYLELSLDNARELNMVSKSSTLNIDKINVLNVNSRRDKFYINNLSSIIGETSFSYFTIKGIQKNVKLKSDYGEVKLKGLDPGFLLIDLESRYTDIILQIPDGLNCEVDMDMTESTYISYPDHYNGLVTKPVEKKDEKGSVKGYIGMKDKANSKVRVSITSGKVVFQDAIQLF